MCANRAERVSVLHVITGLGTGGTERMLQKLLRVRHPSVVQTVVQLQSGGSIATEIRGDGVEVVDLSMRRSVGAIYQAGQLVRLARRVRPDIIQTWLYHADVAGAIAGRLLSLPVVWNIRGSDNPGIRRPIVRICAALSRIPALVIANSEAGRLAHERVGYRAREWRVVPNGFDTKVFVRDASAKAAVRRELGIPADAKIVGMIARADPLKDHRMFFDAVRLALAVIPGIYVVLVGEGMDTSSQLAVTYNMNESMRGRIFSLGRRDDIARLTAAFDVACLASLSEGFPNVIGEAMACEVPCVVTDTGAAREIVGDTGIVVRTGDATAFADGIVRSLQRSAPEQRALGERARRRIVNNFSIESVSESYIKLYSAVIKGNCTCVE